MIRIDEKLALELLRKAVEEKGAGWVDPNAAEGQGCQYVDDQGAPSCIVGHAMVFAGVPSSDLIEDGDVYDLAQGLTHKERLYLERGALRVMMEAQSWQDRGTTWGEALEAAERDASIPWSD